MEPEYNLLVYNPRCRRSQTALRLLNEHGLISTFRLVDVAAIPPEKRPAYVPTAIVRGTPQPLHGNEIFNWINNAIRMNQRTNNILLRDRVDAHADAQMTPVLLEARGVIKQTDALRGLNHIETGISPIYTTVRDEEQTLQRRCESVNNYHRPSADIRTGPIRVQPASAQELLAKDQLHQQSREQARAIVQSKMRDFIPESLIYNGKK